jgi:hypothetical protein
MNTTVAFLRPGASGAPEVVVNFGPLTGREATLAEIDRLARRLLEVAARVRVHAVRTHDMTPETETIVHQVDAEADAAASDSGLLRDICEDWAVDCAEERSLEPLGLCAPVGRATSRSTPSRSGGRRGARSRSLPGRRS